MSAWQTVALGKFAESVEYGVTASATEQQVGPKFLRITDIQNGAVNWDRVPWCQCDARVAADSRLNAGDIVFARTGATTGKSFLIRECPADAVFASYLIRVRVGAAAEARYVSHFFQTPNYWAQITRGARGVAQPGVNATTLRALEIPLPPLPEQRRIVEMLDRSEGLRVKRRAALTQLDTFTQAVFLDLFGDPTTNPMGWTKGVLGDVATFVGGGTPSRARPDYFTGSICWATSKDMKSEFLDDTEERITQQAIEDSATKLVPAGTILVVVKSKILAHHLPVAVARVPTCFGQDLKGIALRERFEVSFVATALRLGERSLLERARGINTEGLTLDHLRAFPLLMPPVSLQSEFARRVATVEKLKTTHRASLAELDALFASLQHRAFRGEL